MKHVVRSGETLGVIALQYETTVVALLRLNPEISDPNCVYVDQSLHVSEMAERQHCTVGQIQLESGCAPQPFELAFYWNDTVQEQDFIYAEIFGDDNNFRQRALFSKANEHLGAVVLPGEIVIISNMPVTADDKFKLNRLKEQAKLASEGIQQLTPEEAKTVKRHIEVFDYVSIEGVANTQSSALGVLSTATRHRLNNLNSVLVNLNDAYIDELGRDPSGNRFSPDFYSKRQQLFRELDHAVNRVTMSRLNIRQYSGIKHTLGLSTKSILHNASEILEQGHVPQLGQRIRTVSAWAKGSKYLGWIGIVIDVGIRTSKVAEACQIGNTAECKRVSFQQGGGLTLSVGGGALGGYGGAKAATLAAGAVALVFGVTLGAPVLIVVALTGAAVGAYAGGAGGGKVGEQIGDVIYERRLN